MKQAINFFLAILAILVVGLLFMIDYQHVEHHTVVINDIQILQHVSGDKESGLSTSYENRILTDKGTYLVSTSGIYSHPEVLGMIHEGDTIIITTRGYEFPFTGKYRNVVDVKTIWK